MRAAIAPVRPNPSFEARPNGRPPGPGRWHAYIFTGPCLASCRWPRLNSNVRHHKPNFMRISYKNTFIDVMRFQMAHQFFSLGYQALILAVCVFVYYAESSERASMESLLIAIGWYVLAWVLQVLITAFILGTKRGPTDEAEHVLEIQSDALLEETKFNRSLHFWNSTMNVVQRGSLCAIYVTPQIAHIIPARAFATKQQRSEFMSLLQQKLREQRPE